MTGIDQARLHNITVYVYNISVIQFANLDLLASQLVCGDNVK